MTTLATVRRTLKNAVKMARLTHQSLVFANQWKPGGKMIEFRLADRFRSVGDHRNQCDHPQNQLRDRTSVPHEHAVHRSPLPGDTFRFRPNSRRGVILDPSDANCIGLMLFPYAVPWPHWGGIPFFFASSS